MSDNIKKKYVVALCGNPNVGKSTVFNELTGLNQHTGNWPGKTVETAFGSFSYDKHDFTLVDLPGTYSLCPNSAEEEVTRDFICFDEHDVTVVVLDATCLERNLNFALQVMMSDKKTVLCVNLMDEAKKKGIEIDLAALSKMLSAPVVAVTARSGIGMDRLIEKINNVAVSDEQAVSEYDYAEFFSTDSTALYDELKAVVDDHRLCLELIRAANDNDYMIIERFVGKERASKVSGVLHYDEARLKNAKDELIRAFVCRAEQIYSECVLSGEKAMGYSVRDRKADRVLTSKKWGIPIMLLLLCFVFWLTIVGANYPSEWLSWGFERLGEMMSVAFSAMNAPIWLSDCIVGGIYKTLSWVVSVMLPPMAIFFPLFTLMEDCGLLPRIAFNMDRFFRSCGAHGKMALTCCMGLGCNACGITGCRIIDSKRERLIAIITNNFIPCNGRFPTIIALISIFLTPVAFLPLKSVITALVLCLVLIIGIAFMWLASKMLSKTVLKGSISSFALELPPFRAPKIGQVLVRSLLDRTLFVLARAICVAAPAGLVIYILGNVYVGDMSLLKICATALDPFGRLLGLDGMIIMALLLGFPANEIVIPIVLMGYLSRGGLTDYDGLVGLKALLVDNGWTVKTAVCMITAVMFHFPCATTTITAYKETKSIKWTALTFLLPTALGVCLCMIENLIFTVF